MNYENLKNYPNCEDGPREVSLISPTEVVVTRLY